MKPKKWILFSAAALLIVIGGGIYLAASQNKLAVRFPIPRKMINRYASEFLPGLTLKYPKNYAVQDYSQSFKALTVSKSADSVIGKLEIFHIKDLDPKTETAQAKEQFTLGSNNNPYTVLLYYPDSDEQTKSELHQIYNSLKVR